MSLLPATAATKRKRPAFSPPRPKASQAGDRFKSGPSKPSGRNPISKQQKPSRPSPATSEESRSDSELRCSPRSDGEFESVLRSTSLRSEPDYVLAEITREDVEENEPSLPLPLIHTILNQHFHDGNKTQISQDAEAVVGKYVDIFVREAIARSTFERQEKAVEDEAGELGGRGNDGWLEVEDLERMAPQLVLDF